MSANVTLVGRLAADPEERATGSGKTVTRFVVITSRRKFNRDTNGWEDADVTSWQCSAWDVLGERVARLRKGNAVVVSGAVSQRSWEDRDTGQKRYAMQVTASNVGLDLRWSEAVAGSSAAPAVESSEPALPAREQSVVDAFAAQEAFDNDIPF